MCSPFTNVKWLRALDLDWDQEPQNGIWNGLELIVTGDLGIWCQCSCSCSSLVLFRLSFCGDDISNTTQDACFGSQKVLIVVFVASSSVLLPRLQKDTWEGNTHTFTLIAVRRWPALNPCIIRMFDIHLRMQNPKNEKMTYFIICLWMWYKIE